MRFILKFLCCLVVSCSALAQNFLPKTDDIPQEKSLRNIEEVANFDSPSERLLILTAVTPRPAQKVEEYYQKTLINLGWEEVEKNVYQRQNDTFKIEPSRQGFKTLIQFTLTQKNEVVESTEPTEELPES